MKYNDILESLSRDERIVACTMGIVCDRKSVMDITRHGLSTQRSVA